MVTMQMPLLNEGTDVWRPVEITPLYGGVYRVEGVMPAGEEWAFPPGIPVEVKWKTFSDGEKRLIPTRCADRPIRHTFGRLLLAGAICSVAAWGVQFLPSSYQPSRPIYAFAWFVAALGGYAALRPTNRYLASVARALSFIFGGVFLVSLFMRK